jgi:hypothetical protein
MCCFIIILRRLKGIWEYIEWTLNEWVAKLYDRHDIQNLSWSSILTT